ncbi:hypothetical protein E2C01_052340 [Portunus trituberculatus]|uniref:Uncharacterized protein n=1 Tax=Portunus trituberculatus TaxID=210409 RepID=A0A5B7GDF4_PORTR|nr:hypothetical protein [Portunus trituberculatus]
MRQYVKDIGKYSFPHRTVEKDQHGSELASLREQHASEMTGMTLQVESLEKSHREEHHKLVEHLTHLSNSLGAQLEEEKGKVLGLQREKEEWEVHKKELEAESEERENLRRSLNEQITVREDLQEKLRQQFGRQLEEERKMENLQNVSESLSEDLKAENEKRKIVEGKLEEEMKNARKWFEEKTALEVNQKQVVLQLQVAEEELAKAVASSIIWSKDKQNLSYEIDALCTEKKCWSQKEELLSKKNESLNAENKDLTEQNKNLGNEKEHLLEQNRSLSNEKEVLTEEREILMKQVQDLTTERESVVQLMEEVRSLGEVVEAGQVERKRLEDVCASKEAELEQLKEKYTQTLASKESDFKELEESYKKKLLSKDIELQELEENFKEKFSLKEKEIKELEEMYEKKCSQKDNELQELLERIALKESELEELKKKDRKMEILHENCLGLLEHLQSGEEERKKIEEECEDKCEMLNTVLRKVDVKLCEATSLVSKQRVSAGEKMQRAGPRSNLEEAPSKLRESETPHISMDRSKCEREMESCKLLEELHYVKEKLEAGKKNEEDLTKQLTLSEKEKKQLANEAEVMRQKIHDQHFTITSLQNEKSRLGQHIMQLEGERSSLRAEESRHQKYKLNMQKELSTLKAEVTTQKQKIKLLQEEMKRFNQAFAALTQEGIDCPEKLRDTLTTLNCLCSKLESLLSSEKEDDPLWLTAFSQELQTQWEHYRTTLDNLMDLQQHTDTLLQDKLEADLRNISLSAELDSFKGNITLDESGMDGGLEGKALEEKEDNENEDLMLKSVREENKVLKQCLDNKSLLLRLERLHLSNPKPNFEVRFSLFMSDCL